MNPFVPAFTVAMAFAQTAAAATFQTFTDRAAFGAAVGAPLRSEDFNGVVGEPSFNGQDLVVGELTLRNDNDVSDRGFIDQPPAAFTAFDVDGTAVANLLITGQSSVGIGFASPITAFGGDFAAFNNDELRGVFSVLGETIAPPVQSGSTVQFFGFVSDMSFSNVDIVSTGPNDGFSLDNAAFGAAVAPVPLPSGGLLLLGALGALALRRRA